MLTDKDKLAIKVAKLYYRSDLSQQLIAEELKISRPTVSRMLQYAKEKEYVSIKLYDPEEDMTQLERELEKKLNIQAVRIASSTINDENEIKKYIGKKAAEYIGSIVKDGDIIGVGWGTTLYEVSCNLEPKQLRGSQIVQMEGGVIHSEWNNYGREIINNFAQNFQTIAQYLPLPIVFDSKETKEMVEKERNIRRVLDLCAHANVAVYSVGTVRPNALFFRLGYTSLEEQKKLQDIAVGDICSRFIDREGQICDKDMDSRTVGINLDTLKGKDYSILVSGGKAKLPAIRAALKGNYANVFITDQFTGQALLED